MKVLVACEESQRVCTAFRAKGHEAYSCDILPCSGGHPEWHIQGDVLPLLNGICSFETMDGKNHIIAGKWDLIIAHPPCTYFSNATMVNLGRKDHPDIFNEDWKRRFFQNRDNAFNFVLKIWNSDCEKIAIENVVGYLSAHFQKPSQYIEPYYFGDPWKKKTCLWLKNLPILEKTNEVVPTGKWVRHHLKTKNDLNGYDNRGVYSAKERSRTFKGVAEAMAEQWGAELTENKMTEAEIMMALECAVLYQTTDVRTYKGMPIEEFSKAVIALIKSKNTEIEEMHRDVKAAEEYAWQMKTEKENLIKTYKECQAEAIKEVLEKVKEKNRSVSILRAGHIDQIAKEMGVEL